MNEIGQPERATQSRVIALFREDPAGMRTVFHFAPRWAEERITQPVTPPVTPPVTQPVEARVGRKSGFIAPSAECNMAHRARLGHARNQCGNAIGLGSCGGRRRQKAAGFSALRLLRLLGAMDGERLGEKLGETRAAIVQAVAGDDDE